jgi:hypothetical protein
VGVDNYKANGMNERDQHERIQTRSDDTGGKWISANFAKRDSSRCSMYQQGKDEEIAIA